MSEQSQASRKEMLNLRPIGDAPALTEEQQQRLLALGIEPPNVAAERLKKQIAELGLASNVADLQERGYTVVGNAAPLEFFDRLRQRLLEIAAEDRDQGRVTMGGRKDSPTGQTVFHLLDRGRVFEEAALNPKLVALLTHLLGRGYTVSTFTGMIRPKGTPQLSLHSDNQYMPQPFPPYSQKAVAVWACDDFNKENGASRLVPRSHIRRRHPKPGEGDDEAIAVECQKGSFVLWGSNMWHGNWARTAPGERVTLHTAFCRFHFRPMECYDDIDPAIIERNPPLFAELIGRNLPYGFKEEGPNPADMLRVTFYGQV